MKVITFFDWLDTKLEDQNSIFYEFANRTHVLSDKPTNNNYKDLKDFFEKKGEKELQEFLFYWKQYRHGTD